MPEETAVEDPKVSATGTDKTVTEVREPVEDKKKKEDSKVFDADYVKELRDEAAKHRTERNAEREMREKLEADFQQLKEQVTAYEREKLSKEERAQLEFEEAKSEVSKLKNEIQSTRLEAAVAKNVKKFNLEDADATVQLLDKEQVVYDDKGYPTNIDTVLEATLERYPFLKSGTKKSAVDTGTTNPGKTRKSGLTKEAIQNMSHQERVDNMQEIQAWAQRGYK